MTELIKFADIFQHFLQTQTLEQLRKNFEICVSKMQLDENDCQESSDFFSKLRQHMLIQKLLKPDDRLGISGTGAFSFVLKFPPKVISSKDETMSLKILSGQSFLAQNEIRALTYTNKNKNDYFIRLEDSLFQNVNGQNICYMLLPHYDMSLLDLVINTEYRDFLPTMTAKINTSSSELTQITDNFIKIVEKLFYTIHFMRSHKMAHRDIKLENILIRLDFTTLSIKNIVLADLGDTCIANESSTNVCGTSVYSAPELFYGAMFNINTTFTMRMMQDIDLYALGQCIYILLSRKMIRTLTKISDTNYFNNFSSPAIQHFYQFRLNGSQGMHMSDTSQMLSRSQSLQDTDIFTEALYGWTHPDVTSRMTYPFDLSNTQSQEEELTSIIRTLQEKSKEANPVYCMTYRIQNNISIETIKSRYNSWIQNMTESVQS